MKQFNPFAKILIGFSATNTLNGQPPGDDVLKPLPPFALPFRITIRSEAVNIIPSFYEYKN